MAANPELDLGRPADLDVTVILCTYNRCQGLKATLESVAASELPASITWEVLVVDNNSTDQTREVVEDFSRRYSGRFRYLFEPKAGKSYALNTGIAEARGEVLAFIDDDVIVERSWLHNLTAELHDGRWAGSAGRILPKEPFTPPPWVPDKFKAIICAHFDLGERPCEMNRPPYGANMAFRKNTFEKHGGFRIDLGPSPDRDVPRPGEDTELGRRLLAAGERLRYEPAAVVYHPIPKGRITKEYFRAWWFDYGRAMIREIGVWPDVYGIPRDHLRLLRCTMALPLLVFRWILTVDPRARFFAKCWIWHRAGMIAELYHRSLDPNRNKTLRAQPIQVPRRDQPEWWT